MSGLVAQGEVFSEKCPGGKNRGDSCPERTFIGGNCPGRNYSGVIVWERGRSPGDNSIGGNCPGSFVQVYLIQE